MIPGQVLPGELRSASGIPMGEPLEFGNLSVGEWVPETPLANYDTLAQVMKKVNSEFQARGLSNRVDESLVKLRDALAHGRVPADVPEVMDACSGRRLAGARLRR